MKTLICKSKGVPGGISGKEPASQCRRHKRRGFDPWVRMIPLEEGIQYSASILAWRIVMDRGAWQNIVHSVTKGCTRLK